MAQDKEREQKSPEKDEHNRGTMEREKLAVWSTKSELERTLSTGIMGKPQLRLEERQQFLGELRERVLKFLTIEQVEEEGTYEEILAALNDPRALKLVVNSQADLQAAREYINLASRNGVRFTTVSSPRLKGEVGLVVVAGTAVDEDDVKVFTREEKLLAKGVPLTLIEARGRKICRECYQLLAEKAPEELLNYSQISTFDHLRGLRCPVPH